jgi:hypothetical protein
MNASGGIIECVTPSRHGVLSFNTARPAAPQTARSQTSVGLTT